MESNFFEIDLAGRCLRVQAGNAHHKHRYVWSGSRHCHGEYELHIVLSGRARVEVGKESHLLTAGAAMLIAPGLYHKATADKGEIERFSLQVAVPEGPLSEILRRKVPQCCVFSVAEHLRGLCANYYYETAAVNPYRRELQQALLTQLLVGVLREIGTEQPTTTAGGNMSPMERMAIIDDFFGEQFSQNAGQEELATRLHLSQRQLARVLQKDYGMGYREMLIRSRMDHAAWLLRTTQQPIPRIAEQVGYRSESAFYKVFFKQYGITPQQYRRENKVE